MKESELIELGICCVREAMKVLDSASAEIIKFKGPTKNVQTQADLEANEAILKVLRESGGSFKVISEEGEPPVMGENPSVEVYIDPIDGSSYFILGNKRLCCTAIMFVENGKVLASFVGDLVTGDIYYCDSKSAYLNGKEISFSMEKKGEKYMVATYAIKGKWISGVMPKLTELAQSKIFVFNNCGPLEQSLVTTGQFDASVDFLPINLWDYCGVAIAQKAGAIVTTTDGKPFEFKNIRQTCISARNEEIHGMLLSALNGGKISGAKKIVCFGGGNAIPKAILEELKNYPVEIICITSAVDSGGSAGAMRKEFNVLPPGDIRRHILTLSEAEDWKKKLWQLRFANDIVFDQGHRGHSFANVFIGGLEYLLKDYEKVLDIVHEYMKVKGRCMPATLDKVHLFAQLEDGAIIPTEDEIDVPRGRDPKVKIKEVWVEPKAKAYGKALSAVEDADVITIGPGDLYSSIIPCFLADGFKEAFRKTKAVKIFIAPAMTKLGETYKYSLEDVIAEAEKYLGVKVDFVVYSTTLPTNERLADYKKKNPHLDELCLPKGKDARFIGRDLIPSEGPIEFESKKLIPIIMELAEGKA